MSSNNSPQPAVHGLTTYAPYEAGYKGPHVPDTSESIDPWETYEERKEDMLSETGVQEKSAAVVSS